MKLRPLLSVLITVMFLGGIVTSLFGQGPIDDSPRAAEELPRHLIEGRRLFEVETFGGNGRTCVTCHSLKTGTVSPREALSRFKNNPRDPLFLHDGCDDGQGNGVTRMLADATILMKIPLAPNAMLMDSLDRFVILPRGIPTTLNTPALDPVLMLDGRQRSLELQAGGAIKDHTQSTVDPKLSELELIRQFQLTDVFFSSRPIMNFARGGPRPKLPRTRTLSELRGSFFFEDRRPDGVSRFGLCALCHSGGLMNQTNEFASEFFGVPVPTGTRFANVMVSEFNVANNPVIGFIFNARTGNEVFINSPDPGRALITGIVDDARPFGQINAFKIPHLRGIKHTAPYFHDNSAKTLEDVAKHYARFFDVMTIGLIKFSAQDEADLVAFMKLLN